MGSRGVSSETGVVVADSQTAACTDLFVCGICDFATSLIHPFLNHFKVHNFSISLDKDTHTCSSQDGASVDKQEDYKCYLCSCLFTTICRLHDHLMKCMTVSNGSYIFDNNKKTAFPFSMQSHHDLSEQAMYNLASTACQDYSTDGDDITSHRAVQFPPNRNNNGLSLDAGNAVIKLERESFSSEDPVSYENELQENIPRLSSDLSTKIDELLTGKQTAAVGMEHVETEKTTSRKIKDKNVTNKEGSSTGMWKLMKVHECHVCLKTFHASSTLKTHLKSHSNERPISCGQCDRKFKYQYQLEDHFVKVHPDACHKCQTCDKLFSTYSKLTNHLRSHDVSQGNDQSQSEDGHANNDKHFTCEQCNKTYKSAQCFKEHKDTHLGAVPKCEICDKTFVSLRTLKVHLKHHTNGRPYSCEECGKTFKQKSHLYVHQNTHLDVMPYVCHVCGKGFTNSSSLKKHMAQHSGDEYKTFKCEKCDAKFVFESQLRRHMHKHTGVKTYQCDLCGTRFSRREFLRGHMQGVHKQEKPFECIECGLKFMTNYQLKCHAMTHSGVRPHGCKYCDAKFIQRKELRKHMKKNHGLDLDDKPMEADMPGANLMDLDASMALILANSVRNDPAPQKYQQYWK